MNPRKRDFKRRLLSPKEKILREIRRRFWQQCLRQYSGQNNSQLQKKKLRLMRRGTAECCSQIKQVEFSGAKYNSRARRSGKILGGKSEGRF